MPRFLPYLPLTSRLNYCFSTPLKCKIHLPFPLYFPARSAHSVTRKSTLITPELRKKVISLRRHIHQYPETAWQEVKTQKFILDELKKIGIKGKKIAVTGVVAMVPGTRKLKPGEKVLMLRADIDALPMAEEVDCEYKSRHEGRMHACGHDAHAAMMLCVAQLLKENPLERPVKLIFQPAEEGGVGAELMIKDGVLEDPPVEAAFGIHVWVGVAAGKMAIAMGPCMAAVDEFVIKVIGKGGHAAYPHGSIDPIMISAEIINSLQTIVSRSLDPIDTAVLTVGSIHGGTNFNIIPPEVVMQGTCRSFSDATRKMIKKRFFDIVNGTARLMGGKVEIEYRHQVPATINDPDMCRIIWDASIDVVGKKNVFEFKPMMGGEDMSLYLRKVPGCFAFLGTKNPAKGVVHPHHHPKFTIDEDVLPDGVEVLYRTAELYYSK